jgi:D-tyrosyl-tRNA(Tyr) deacylase
VRVVIQRVAEASVTVDGSIVGQIGPGMLALVGIEEADTREDVGVAAGKLTGLRIFGDDAGKMNLSVGDTGGSVLVVSQFTLLGDVRRGRRPSFTSAARPDHAKKMVERLVDEIRSAGIETSTGVFGEHMSVELVNDGPVTLVIEVKDGRIL